MDWAFAYEAFFDILQGLPITIFLVISSMIVGNLLAIPVAVARVGNGVLMHPGPVTRRLVVIFVQVPAYLFILVMRGTPLIVQMFLIYYGLSQFEAVRESIFWPILKEPIWCAVIALSINTAAYSGEILRGALQNVPQGLVEGSRTLGLSAMQTLATISLPIAFRYCLPALSNETVLLLKASAISFTITVQDVMGRADVIRAQSYKTYEPLLTAAIFYLVLTFILVRGFRWLEARLGQHVQPQEEKTAAGVPTG